MASSNPLLCQPADFQASPSVLEQQARDSFSFKLQLGTLKFIYRGVQVPEQVGQNCQCLASGKRVPLHLLDLNLGIYSTKTEEGEGAQASPILSGDFCIVNTSLRVASNVTSQELML